MRTLSCLCLSLSLVLVQAANLDNDLSFFPPFKTIDSNGERMVQNWRSMDTTVIKEHFIRLTPDRQSKVGKLWATKELSPGNAWSAMLRFRVSGQGKRLFGDGFAFWFTDMNYPQAGQLFGVTENFKGFAVIFDTFKNTEMAHAHKDVSIIRGTGEGALERKDNERPGCDAAFRLHEKRADFDVHKSAFAKLTFRGTKLTVDVDALGDGSWVQCFEDDNVLPEGFDLSKAYIGLTATTGQLADNHDVLGMALYHMEPHETTVETAMMSRLVKANGETEMHAGEQAVVEYAEGRLQTDELGQAVTVVLDREKKGIYKKLSDMNHKLEHQLTHVTDGLQHAVDKLRKQEEAAERRIKELEDKLAAMVKDHVDGHVQSKIDEKVNAVEANLQNQLGEHTSAIVDSIQQDVQDTLTTHKESTSETVRHLTAKADEAVASAAAASTMSQGGGGWFLPFLILMIFVCGGFGFVVFKYRELKHQHLL